MERSITEPLSGSRIVLPVTRSLVVALGESHGTGPWIRGRPHLSTSRLDRVVKMTILDDVESIL